ncbi:NUDIX hydrolase [Paenibacillus dendritiformis]|uniref:NUDIX hydrolase n=1 Tax=Paenibacillus dendritiformis C454 TaxID=1131935 RepID=H3SP34_9BACL|nr:8-oxo-dGTP diphosphatase [Paenibacillus dendritiformis]EHQ59190.1 NUDIX hydrolase [Paenibacillus dendritiformis C454]CAH8771133.1 8-oxo-dGTP diphosphatase [Paenibacillus dendritiformis]
MLKYTLCLIKQGSKILLLNREKPAWMGCWNGVGGKIEKNEQPRASMLREIREETGIEALDLTFKGLITWTTGERRDFGGLYLYAAAIPEEQRYPTPVKTAEGILDWKELRWIMHPDNAGVASNIRSCLEQVLHDEQCYNHHCIFVGDSLIEQITTPIDLNIEYDEAARMEYIMKYMSSISEAAAAIS